MFYRFMLVGYDSPKNCCSRPHYTLLLLRPICPLSRLCPPVPYGHIVPYFQLVLSVPILPLCTIRSPCTICPRMGILSPLSTLYIMSPVPNVHLALRFSPICTLLFFVVYYHMSSLYPTFALYYLSTDGHPVSSVHPVHYVTCPQLPPCTPFFPNMHLFIPCCLFLHFHLMWLDK